MHFWQSKDKLLSKILLWIPSHWHWGIGRPAKTYIQQFLADIDDRQGDLPRAMADRDECQGFQESLSFDDDDDDDDNYLVVKYNR